MNVLLTGATGFLGAWVAHCLRERGHETCQLDSHGRPARGCVWSVPRFLADADAVVHLAWFSQAGRAYPTVHRYCLERFKEVVRQASWAAPPECLHVFASTASVYGDRGDLVCQEGFDLAPNCDYTRAKVEAEHHLRTWVPRNHCILRLGSLMGVGAPGGRTKTDVIVNAFASEGYQKRRIEVWNPDSYKPLLHVKDAAELVVRAVAGDHERGKHLPPGPGGGRPGVTPHGRVGGPGQGPQRPALRPGGHVPAGQPVAFGVEVPKRGGSRPGVPGLCSGPP
jgi:nucleoside-diphosphate-sugar epimerase